MNEETENLDDSSRGDDEVLRLVLRDAPVRPPRQLHGIRTRARAIRAHRQALTLGAVVAGVFVIAGAVATATVPFERIDFAPAGSPDPTADIDCSGDDMERYGAVESVLGYQEEVVSGASNVPDDVRWLWPEDSAPDPVRVDADDRSERIAAYDELYRDCAPVTGESVVLASATDDGSKIWRTIYLERVPEPAVESRTSEGSDDHLQVGDIEVTVHNRWELVAKGNLWSRLTASWSDGENTWYLAAEPLAYDQLTELVEKVRYTDGKIDLGGWSVAKDSEFIDRGVSKFHARYTGSASFHVGTNDVWLSAHDMPMSMWLGMPASSKPVTVNGKPAAIHKNGYVVRWQSEDGVTLELAGTGLSQEELIKLAESVQRVPEDDPRLGDDIWDY